MLFRNSPKCAIPRLVPGHGRGECRNISVFFLRVFSFSVFFSRPCHPFFHVYVNPGTQNVGMRGVTELNSKFRGRCIRIQCGAVHTFNCVILRKLNIQTHGTYYRNVQFTHSSVNIPQRTHFYKNLSYFCVYSIFFLFTYVSESLTEA